MVHVAGKPLLALHGPVAVAAGAVKRNAAPRPGHLGTAERAHASQLAKPYALDRDPLAHVRLPLGVLGSEGQTQTAGGTADFVLFSDSCWTSATSIIFKMIRYLLEFP